MDTHSSGTLSATRAARPALANDERWRSIETAPRDGTPVLSIHPDYQPRPALAHFALSANPDEGGRWCPVGDHAPYLHQPTHWMPLAADEAAGEGAGTGAEVTLPVAFTAMFVALALAAIALP